VALFRWVKYRDICDDVQRVMPLYLEIELDAATSTLVRIWYDS
jgi:hypothetical protein